MRIWADWTHEERVLFTRTVREDLSHMSLSSRSEIEAMRIEIHIRPLERSEIERMNFLLDGAVYQATGRAHLAD